MADERQARRALRRAARQTRRTERRTRRQARREDLAALLTPLVQAAEVLITTGADRLIWVVDQFLACVDVPGLDEAELSDLIEDAVELIVAQLFPGD